MSPRSEAISEIQRLLKATPDALEILNQIHQMEQKVSREEIDAHTTRAFVLISVGMLEGALAVAIESFLPGLSENEILRKKIFDGDHEKEGIIGTLYTRTVVAYALNIFGKNTFDDLNSVRQIRNLCAHAKSDVDFSSEKLKPLSQFHSIESINNAFGLGEGEKLQAISPVHGVLMFFRNFIPYLLLHGSKGYVGGVNHAGWRGTFS